MLKTNRKIKSIILLLILSIATLSTMVIQTQAAIKLYDEYFSTDLVKYNDFYIEFRIIVWHNQHVEIEVTYIYFDEDEDMCTFFWIAVVTRYTNGSFNHDIPDKAPDEIKEGYVDIYGNLNQQMWEAGQRMIFIDVEMYFYSYALLGKYAIQRLVLINYNNLFAIGWARSFYVEIVNYHIVD